MKAVYEIQQILYRTDGAINKELGITGIATTLTRVFLGQTACSPSSVSPVGHLLGFESPIHFYHQV